MKFRPIIIILFISLLGSFQVNAAVKWNNSSSSPRNDASIDVDSLEQKEVPKGFPHIDFTLAERCNDSNRHAWSDKIRVYYSKGFLWGSHINFKEARLYVGRKTLSGRFEINVSSAAKSWSDKSTWIKYKFPKNLSFSDALKNGVKGTYKKGKYKRTCTISRSEFGISENHTPKQRKRALEELKSSQLRLIKSFASFGVSKGSVYKFEPESIKIPESIQTANASSNNYAETGIVWADLGNTVVCHIANQTPNNHWTKEKIGNGLKEAKKRGLDCVRNNNGVETLIVEGVETPVKQAVDREKQRKAEEEQRRLAELEKQRKAEEEQRRLAELEKQRKAEEEQRQLAELEKQRKAEEEQRRLAELEKQRKAEEEQRRLAELEKQRKAEEEQRRLAELEKQRKAEEEQRRLAELEKQRKVEEEQRRLAELEKQRRAEEEQRRLAQADKSAPYIELRVIEVNGYDAQVGGLILDDTGIESAQINGSPLDINENGEFNLSVYVPRTGTQITVQALDKMGKLSEQELFIERQERATLQAAVFDGLNPTKRRAKKNRNAIALIIGISSYQRTEVPAIYADDDAKYFYDYAMLKLGVPESNIREFINEKADQFEILLATKKWLKRQVVEEESDIYLFFAGHGLASEDGNKMFMLPYDGAPELLDKTAILREELFADIASTKPRSVTVFMDTCYSGTTRGTETLIASRPIAIRAKKQSIPDGFTVLTAASAEETAKPLEEAKHGMFSYFVMKGMEGEADLNGNNEITAKELHAYVQKNVVKQSSGKQTPELQGAEDKVLVRFE